MADLEDPVWKGYMLAGVLCGVTIIRSLLNQLAMHIDNRTGMHVRSAFVGIVFRKVSDLRWELILISITHRQDVTVME